MKSYQAQSFERLRMCTECRNYFIPLQSDVDYVRSQGIHPETIKVCPKCARIEYDEDTDEFIR
jgi:hypothetical protein